jgi:hypothetical protein
MLIVALVSSATAAQPPVRPGVHIPGTDLVLREGWQLFSTSDLRCMYVAPVDWRLMTNSDAAQSADGRSWIAAAAIDPALWETHRAQILRDTGAVVHADTAHRLWVERREGTHLWHHIAVTDGQHACGADLLIYGSSSLDVTTVANGVQPTPRALVGGHAERP